MIATAPKVGGATRVAKSPANCAAMVRISLSFSGTNPVSDHAAPGYVMIDAARATTSHSSWALAKRSTRFTWASCDSNTYTAIVPAMIMSRVRGLMRSSSMCSTSASGRISISWSRRSISSCLFLRTARLVEGLRATGCSTGSAWVRVSVPITRRAEAIARSAPTSSAWVHRSSARSMRNATSPAAMDPSPMARIVTWSSACNSRWSAVSRRCAIPAARSLATPRQELSNASSLISSGTSVLNVWPSARA